jgi:hypothetical protein
MRGGGLRVGDKNAYRPSDPNALLHPRLGVSQNRVALLGTTHCQSARLKQGSGYGSNRYASSVKSKSRQ